MTVHRQLVQILLLILLSLYRVFRPFFVAHPGPTCRFVPTCSVYACQAIETFGVVRGLVLTVKRLLKCHPLGGEGVDFYQRSDRLAENSSADTFSD